MKQKIGLALGSGGARGWCHIGAIQVLNEAGIEPDIVCGASMGALVGAAYVSGVLPELEAYARSLTQVSVTRLVDFNMSTGGLIGGKLVDRQLRELGYKADFDELDRPFLVVASDIFNAREIWLRDGDVVECVRASIAVPGILAPTYLNERWLMDGGMTNPVPVSACRALGADIVIAVDPNSKQFAGVNCKSKGAHRPKKMDMNGLLKATPHALWPYMQSLLASEVKPEVKPPGYFTVLSAATDLMTDQIRRSRMVGDPPHILVNADLTHLTALDLHRAGEAIADGRRAMEENMDYLLSYL